MIYSQSGQLLHHQYCYVDAKRNHQTPEDIIYSQSGQLPHHQYCYVDAKRNHQTPEDMIYSQSGQLPHHQYCYVDASFISSRTGFIPCVWFGLVSIPGRAWGCTIMLECGAIYRAVPPHALAFHENPESNWRCNESQRWDCYSTNFSTIEYTYLRGVTAEAKAGGMPYKGQYLFTVAPIDDGFSRYPEQAKEFCFIQLDNGRLTIQPTDKVLFHDSSFVTPDWPTDLKTTTEIYSCE